MIMFENNTYFCSIFEIIKLKNKLIDKSKVKLIDKLKTMICAMNIVNIDVVELSLLTTKTIALIIF